MARPRCLEDENALQALSLYDFATAGQTTEKQHY